MAIKTWKDEKEFCKSFEGLTKVETFIKAFRDFKTVDILHYKYLVLGEFGTYQYLGCIDTELGTVDFSYQLRELYEVNFEMNNQEIEEFLLSMIK